MSIDFAKLATPFEKKDWEWRVEQAGISKDIPWCLVVPYIQNRAIQSRLDDVCGANNWRNEFKEWKDNAQLCGISIYDPDKKDWVTKWDGAEDTNFESIKGGLSASMKRAAVQWGIGRHLYEEKEVYAECTTEKKKGWSKAQTKDKQDIWWNPNDPQLTGVPAPPPRYTKDQLDKTKIPTAQELQKGMDIKSVCKAIVGMYGEIDNDFLDMFAKKYQVDYYEADEKTLNQCLNDMKKKKEGKA